MEKGFNSDLKIRGDFFHIQTEDWGADAMTVVSRIFKNGAVIHSIKTPYGLHLKNLSRVQKSLFVRNLLRNQHRQILDFLQNGQMFDEKLKLRE